MTSIDCPTGTDRVVEALQQLHFTRNSIIVNIQGDAPLLESQVVHEVIELLRRDEHEMMATAAFPIMSEEEARDPHVVKCILDKTNHALYFSRGLIPHSGETGYNPSVQYYHHLGLYAYRYEFLNQFVSLEPTPLQLAEDLEQLKALEHGFSIKVAIVESRSFGVDRPEDIKRVEKVL